MAKRVPAGEMRHEVSFERNSGEGTYDTYGQISASSSDWVPDETMRAKLEALHGDELVVARQLYPTVSHRITIDYYSTMATTGATRRRFEFGGRYLYIQSIRDIDEEHFQLEMLCGEAK